MAKKASDAAPPNRRRATTPRRTTTPRRDATSDSASTSEIPSSAPSAPSADEIAQEAYLRYLSRGGGDGQDFDDWLEAEQELKKRRNGG